MSSIVAVCEGTRGELGPPIRRFFAWYIARTPLPTIPASLDELVADFSLDSAMGVVISSVQGDIDPSLISTCDRSWVGATCPITGLFGGVL